MPVNIEDVLLLSLAQDGDPYEFGAKASPAVADPRELDCSGLVTWSCLRAGMNGVPHGAYGQWKWSREQALPVVVGVKTRGALLFVGDGSGVGRDAITHVAWSLGDGTTIEARGEKWGIGVWPSSGRFDYAAKIPGAAYGPAKVPPVRQPVGRPPIRRGMSGPHVKYLQTVLRKRGFRWHGAPIVAGGQFGPITERLVKDIQAWALGVKRPDGIVGPRTWAVIDQLARA